MISFSLKYSEERLERTFQARMRVPLLYRPYYYLSSETYPDLFCIPSESPTEIFPMELGLLSEAIEDIDEYRIQNPNTKSIQVSKLTNNFKKCLILATGFIVPKVDYKLKKQVPFYYHLKNEEVFCIAGVYDEIKPNDYTTAYVISNNFPLAIKKGYEFEYLKGHPGALKNTLRVMDFKSYKLNPDIYYKDGNYNRNESLIRDK